MIALADANGVHEKRKHEKTFYGEKGVPYKNTCNGKIWSKPCGRGIIVKITSNSKIILLYGK